MMYLYKIIVLYTLNLHSTRCQLYLNKTGGEKADFSPEDHANWKLMK